jgi:hypothetical protein
MSAADEPAAADAAAAAANAPGDAAAGAAAAYELERIHEIMDDVVEDPSLLFDVELALLFADRLPHALGATPELHRLGCDAVAAICAIEPMPEPFKKDILRSVLSFLKQESWCDGGNEERWAMGCQVCGGGGAAWRARCCRHAASCRSPRTCLHPRQTPPAPLHLPAAPQALDCVLGPGQQQRVMPMVCGMGALQRCGTFLRAALSRCAPPPPPPEAAPAGGRLAPAGRRAAPCRARAPRARPMSTSRAPQGHGRGVLGRERRGAPALCRGARHGAADAALPARHQPERAAGARARVGRRSPPGRAAAELAARGRLGAPGGGPACASPRCPTGPPRAAPRQLARLA